ncbi:MAG: 2-alkenal reductase [Pedosphaera sp.]|nr:2-alkenal reductase [Pedosphaera sp.]
MKIADFYLLSILAAALVIAPLTGHTAPPAAAKPNPNLDLARQLNQAFVEVAEEVSPAVVVITVTQKASPTPSFTPGQDGSEDNSEDPMDHIPPEFRRFFRQQEKSPEPTRGQGSGIIIRKDGYILTNRHVVDDAEKIEVRLKDGRTFKAEVRGVDAPSDVAVIKIDATELPVAILADSSKTRVGEFAIAIGAPFALDYSVTFGHVSAKDRSNILQDDPESNAMTDQNFIQTDANINPGNSGGPLININGEVIGINTLIRGLHTGIGFAIPINMAREVADKLITEGKFTRAWLGIRIVSLREYPVYRDLVRNVQDGVVVREIVPNGPAAKANLQPADVITAIDGKSVITAQQLKDEIRTKAVGQNVNLDVVRMGKPAKVVLKPGEWVDKNLAANTKGSGATEGNSAADLGFSVKALTRDLANQYGVELVEGVIITSVDKTGLAANNGIKPGDIITSVNQQPVTNPKQFRDVIKSMDVKKGVIINLLSEGTAKFEILKDGAD